MGNIFGDAWDATTGAVSDAASWTGEKASAVGGAFHDIYNSATGGQTNAQQAVQEKIQGAKKDAHQDLARMRKERQDIDFGESDPASIKQHDNWDNWNREQLANKLKPSLKTEQINSSAQAWKKLGEEISKIFSNLDAETRNTAKDGMRGEAAEAGMNAAKPLQDWGTKFGDAVRGTGFKMEEAGIAAERTRDSIQEAPEPSNARAVIDGGMNAIAPGSGMIDGGNQMREREEGERQARQIVKNVYTPGYDKVDGSTPSFPKPVDPLNPSPSKSGDGNANGIGIPAGQTPGGGGPTTATPASMSANTTGDPGSSSVPGGTANPGTGSPASPGNTPSSPASNSSASAIPPGAGTPGGPGSGTPGTTSPGGPGGGGGAAFGAMPGGGAPGGAPGGGQPGGQGGAGRPGPGGRAGVGGSGGGQGGTAAAQGGGQNGSGRGGMGGGGQRGGGQQEDEEHERPSWLEENDDVWFNDMPKTAPPVLGG